jgi:hypothetical protein
MDLKDYFASAKGTGIFSTADAEGRVNSAVYSRPHFLDDGNLGWIMPDKLTHVNLNQNGKACFLWKDEGSQRDGVRLYLTKVGEDTDQERISAMRKIHRGDDSTQRFLVMFKVDKVLPLIGPGKEK